jgi:hypothetical protein
MRSVLLEQNILKELALLMLEYLITMRLRHLLHGFDRFCVGKVKLEIISVFGVPEENDYVLRRAAVSPARECEVHLIDYSNVVILCRVFGIDLLVK